MQKQRIIIGGGMAGLSCAFRLMEAGEEFTLISENLGGRICYSPVSKVNYGAYFVMSSYTHAKKLVTEEALINPLHACFHNSPEEHFGVLSGHTLTLLPEFIRFFAAMQEFSRHYEAYKKRCLTQPQKEALAADPYMADLFVKPAAQFIHEKRLDKVAADYIGNFAYACTGVSTEHITALDFLNVSMGILVPIHKFSFSEDGTASRLGAHYVKETVTKIEQKTGSYTVTVKSGEQYEAEQIVVATPASVTQQLLKLPEIREACQLYVFHVQATLKGILGGYELNLFPSTSPLILTARQEDGTYLIYATEKEYDLSQVCEKYTLLRTVAWEKAMYVQGRAFMEQQIGDSLFIAGDHNGLGLEPTAISGLYAANQILASAATHSKSVKGA
jgi:Protoporphyrinogen oxidase